MANAFTAGLRTLFNDPNLGDAAIYTPFGGVGVALRVVVTRAPIDAFEVGRAGVRLSPASQPAARVADVQVSDVGQPRRGDTLTIGPETYTVSGEPEIDEKRLTWRLTLGLPS